MHVPLQIAPPPDRGIYGAALREMDALVGRVKHLADSCGKGSTLLWFTGKAPQLAVVVGDGCAPAPVAQGNGTSVFPQPLMCCDRGPVGHGLSLWGCGSHAGPMGSSSAGAHPAIPHPPGMACLIEPQIHTH